MNPRVPLDIAKIGGICLFLNRWVAHKIVPSPPMVIIKSIFYSWVKTAIQLLQILLFWFISYFNCVFHVVVVNAAWSTIDWWMAWLDN